MYNLITNHYVNIINFLIPISIWFLCLGSQNFRKKKLKILQNHEIDLKRAFTLHNFPLYYFSYIFLPTYSCPWSWPHNTQIFRASTLVSLTSNSARIFHSGNSFVHSRLIVETVRRSLWLAGYVSWLDAELINIIHGSSFWMVKQNVFVYVLFSYSKVFFLNSGN